jgi:hypothetical protein
MKKFLVHKFCRYWVVIVFWGLLAATAGAQTSMTLHPKNGPAVTGTVLDMGDAGIRLQLEDGTFMSSPIPWGLLSLDDLKMLQQDPKAREYVEPFIPIPKAQKLERTEVDIKEPPRLDRPAAHSLFGALAGSSVGLVSLLLLYLANLYAAYEISIFRAQPPALVCGVSAVAPLLGPVIFLAMPTREVTDDGQWAQAAPDEGLEAAIVVEQAEAPAPSGPGHRRAPTQPVAAPGNAPAPGKTFMRGQFTFNRRFFETQMPGFFAMIRPEADRNTTLLIKSARGTHVAQRISRISPNEIHIQVVKGHASEEITIPFLEIQEVHLKPAGA